MTAGSPSQAASLHSLLDGCPGKPLPQPRTTHVVGDELRQLVGGGQLDLPVPGTGRTALRWTALAALGRRDLTLARLAEGHVDAIAILAEAGRPAVPGMLYGVWAARSAGTGAEVVRDGNTLRLTGTVRFCSGATTLDRALVAAAAPDPDAGPWLVDIDLCDSRVHRDAQSWTAIGMDASDSLDVTFEGVPLSDSMIVDRTGWYLTRRGFALGSGGVAAVWLGGTAAVLDDTLALLHEAPRVDEHQLAHVGALTAALRAADALLADTAWWVDANRAAAAVTPIRTAKAAVERAAWEVRDRVPRITGPTPLCRDRGFAQRLADLEVYVRQHHAERDLAVLGREVLAAQGWVR